MFYTHIIIIRITKIVKSNNFNYFCTIENNFANCVTKHDEGNKFSTL